MNEEEILPNDKTESCNLIDEQQSNTDDDTNSTKDNTCDDNTDRIVNKQTTDTSKKLADILNDMNVSDSVATSAKAILEPLLSGSKPGQNIIKLIVKALTHDQDIKDAEASGYLRGRNETIEAATKFTDEQQPQPVTFPIYRKRSFWDK